MIIVYVRSLAAIHIPPAAKAITKGILDPAKRGASRMTTQRAASDELSEALL
jgi:hypothetical protein